ncbi:hypothetical protein ACVWZ3_005876 [Bradyrhizobium sp. i1.3.6]
MLETLTHAKIEIGSGDAQSGFELTFDLPVRSPLRTIFLLAGGGALPPLLRVVLIVTINGTAESVIDGMVTNVETQPGSGGVGKLVIKGKDMSALMDIIELPGLPFPAMPPSVRVLAILAKYAALGVIPMVIPSVLDIPPIPVQQIPQQKGSDYAYVKKLAGEAGYVFLSRGRSRARRLEGLLGPGNPLRRAAAGTHHQHGCAHQCRGHLVQLRQGTQGHADRVLPGGQQQGTDPGADP